MVQLAKLSLPTPETRGFFSYKFFIQMCLSIVIMAKNRRKKTGIEWTKYLEDSCTLVKKLSFFGAVKMQNETPFIPSIRFRNNNLKVS